MEVGLDSKEKVLKGKIGESKAIEYLLSIEHKILQQNYRNFLGEIDIISVQGETVFFIEVKFWRFGLTNPLESFTKKKVDKMRKLAEKFLSENKEYSRNYYISFCLIEVKEERVNLYKNLF